MELKGSELLRRVDNSEFDFSITAEIVPGREPIAQNRAKEALEFSVGMPFPGYNLYALGPLQTDKRALITKRLEELAATKKPPSDWCYIQNFDDPAKPLCIQLTGGEGRLLKHRMQDFINSVRMLVPAALSSDDYQRKSEEITSTLKQRQTSDASVLESEAKEKGLVMLPTPNGFIFAPIKDDKVMEQGDFLALTEEDRKKIQSNIDFMTQRLLSRLRDYPQYQQKLVQDQQDLIKKTAEQIITNLIEQLNEPYQNRDAVIHYLSAVKEDLLGNVDKLMTAESIGASAIRGSDPEQFFDRFSVNLLVDSSELSGAPILYESNPSLDNLVGKLEHRIEFGMPVTDFNLIRPGALHKANGGYLLLDADRLLQKPFAWEALKRAISDRSVRIESVSQLVNLTYSVSLEPEPVQLDLKVILLGSRRLYHLLRQYDPDFDELFKVVADFDDDVEWTSEHINAYSSLIAQTVIQEGLRHLDAGAVARVLEYSSRLVEDRKRLSTYITVIRDLLAEADYFASVDGVDLIERKHVSLAIEKRIFRLDRFRELISDNIARGLILVETAGAKVGQINGLSIVNIGQMMFGQPMRITATARLGRGELIDIERESRLGGKIHSKAVMIVSSFIGFRYAKDQPLSLCGSLVFEQSYGGVEGDSASIAEVCALISAIIEKPILQNLAVTGSMDQHGVTQAIGGVNEKIEGFYDVCASEGLNGDHGVIVPASNRDHLMLREDVVEAVDKGLFHVYVMETVDDAMGLLFAEKPNQKIDVSLIDKKVRERLLRWHDIWLRAAKDSRSVQEDSATLSPGSEANGDE